MIYWSPPPWELLLTSGSPQWILIFEWKQQSIIFTSYWLHPQQHKEKTELFLTSLSQFNQSSEIHGTASAGQMAPNNHPPEGDGHVTSRKFIYAGRQWVSWNLMASSMWQELHFPLLVISIKSIIRGQQLQTMIQRLAMSIWQANLNCWSKSIAFQGDCCLLTPFLMIKGFWMKEIVCYSSPTDPSTSSLTVRHLSDGQSHTLAQLWLTTGNANSSQHT